VLLVDDNDFNLYTLSLLLQKNFGLNSYKAYNGEEGFEEFKRLVDKGDVSRFSILIFMDVSMPIMNGHQCTQLIRDYEKEKGLEECYIIGVSAHHSKEIKKECFEVGMNAFLTKPIDLESLKEIIGKLNSK